MGLPRVSGNVLPLDAEQIPVSLASKFTFGCKAIPRLALHTSFFLRLSCPLHVICRFRNIDQFSIAALFLPRMLMDRFCVLDPFLLTYLLISPATNSSIPLNLTPRRSPVSCCLSVANPDLALKSADSVAVLVGDQVTTLDGIVSIAHVKIEDRPSSIFMGHIF
jgi:hypothetical protein